MHNISAIASITDYFYCNYSRLYFTEQTSVIGNIYKPPPIALMARINVTLPPPYCMAFKLSRAPSKRSPDKQKCQKTWLVNPQRPGFCVPKALATSVNITWTAANGPNRGDIRKAGSDAQLWIKLLFFLFIFKTTMGATEAELVIFSVPTNAPQQKPTENRQVAMSQASRFAFCSRCGKLGTFRAKCFYRYQVKAKLN